MKAGTKPLGIRPEHICPSLGSSALPHMSGGAAGDDECIIEQVICIMLA